MFFVMCSVLKERLKKFRRIADVSFEKDNIVFHETVYDLKLEFPASDPNNPNLPTVIKHKIPKEISAKINKSHILSYDGSGKSFNVNVRLFKRMLSGKQLRFDVQENELRIAEKFRSVSFFN